MNLVSGAMRRPVTVLVALVAIALGAGLAVQRMPRDIFPTLGSGHLRGAAVWRHGPGADGRLPHLLLRVPLPLHHRHRARRIEVDPGRRADQAAVPSGHEHGAGDGGDGRRTSTARGRSCRRARCRRSSCGSTPAACRSATWSSPARRERVGEDAGRGAEPGPAAVRDAAGRLGAAAVRREPRAPSWSTPTRTGCAPTTCRPTRSCRR